MLLFIGIYIGHFNPRSIEVNNLTVDTPKNYYIWSANKDYNNIDISCGYSFGCNKKISTAEVENGLNEYITIIYKTFIPSEILSLTISDLSKVKLQFEELKHSLLQDEIDRRTSLCLINIDEKITLTSNDIRYRIIYHNENIKSIDIIASDKTAGEDLVRKLCQ